MLEFVAVIKQIVLMMFFLTFTGVIAWTYSKNNVGLEDKRFLPLEDRHGHG